MVAITDKFGKASVDTNYAVATTVKTTRTVGATVLEAYDLSKFSPSTPVFFVTYKKTTDPVTGVTSVTNLVSWKAIVNVGANTLTNLTLAPGYSDTGNAVGDFIECIPTSFWENSLMDGIFVGHNPDGTLKTQAVLDALGLSSNNGYTPLANTPNTVTANGNGSYNMVFNGVDLTSFLSNGMRLRTTRTVAAPTQCANLNGTNQYLSKTSPVGMTFTDDFVAGAWVKVTGYGSDQSIFSCYNGTNGWDFKVGSSGLVQLSGFKSGGGNNTCVASYQSIPLNRWVFVAAQLDMSTATLTPTTNYIIIDGTDVPAQRLTAGTAPTSLTQGGNFEVGSRVSGTNTFGGKIKEAFVTSGKLTQTQVRAIYSQGLTTADVATYGIVSAYSLSNSLNDLNTTNANNLTAQNGATTTTVDAPWTQNDTGVPGGMNDYAIQMSKTYSGGNTTLTVQVPEGCTIPTSGGIASVVYSSNATPYGFPADKNRWIIETRIYAEESIGVGAYNTWTDSHSRITAPVGKFNVGWSGSPYESTTVSGALNTAFGLYDGGTFHDPDLQANSYCPTGTVNMCPAYRRKEINVTTPTTYILSAYVINGSGGISWRTNGGIGSGIGLRLFLENAYL